MSEGQLAVASQIVCKPNTVLRGQGAATVLNYSGAANAITFSGSAPRVWLEYFNLAGDSPGGHGVFQDETAGNGGHIYATNLSVSGFTASGKYGVYLDYCHGMWLKGNIITNNANGLFLKKTFYSAAVEDCHIRDNTNNQATIRNMTGKMSGCFVYGATDPTDTCLRIEDCAGFTLGPGNCLDGDTNGLRHILEITKSAKNFGSEGVPVLGNKFEFLAGYAGAKRCIRVAVASGGVSFGGNNFLQRSDYSPILIEAVDANRIQDVYWESGQWDNSKPPIEIADTACRDVGFAFLEEVPYSFALADVPAGQTNAAVPVLGGVGNNYWTRKRAWCVEITVRLSAAVPTGESLTVTARVGTSAGLAVTLGAGVQSNSAWQHPFIVPTFGGGDITNCVYTSTNNGGWDATVDMVVTVRLVESNHAKSVTP